MSVTIEIETRPKTNAIFAQESPTRQIVVSGAIVIEARFCIGFADRGYLADFSDVLHEVQIKPTQEKTPYAAPTAVSQFMN